MINFRHSRAALAILLAGFFLLPMMAHDARAQTATCGNGSLGYGPTNGSCPAGQQCVLHNGGVGIYICENTCGGTQNGICPAGENCKGTSQGGNVVTWQCISPVCGDGYTDGSQGQTNGACASGESCYPLAAPGGGYMCLVDGQLGGAPISPFLSTDCAFRYTPGECTAATQETCVWTGGMYGCAWASTSVTAKNTLIMNIPPQIPVPKCGERKYSYPWPGIGSFSLFDKNKSYTPNFQDIYITNGFGTCDDDQFCTAYGTGQYHCEARSSQPVQCGKGLYNRDAFFANSSESVYDDPAGSGGGYTCVNTQGCEWNPWSEPYWTENQNQYIPTDTGGTWIDRQFDYGVCSSAINNSCVKTNTCKKKCELTGTCQKCETNHTCQNAPEMPDILAALFVLSGFGAIFTLRRKAAAPRV